MPFTSAKQRRYMWMAHPDIARRWSHGKHSARANKQRSGHRGGRR